MLRYHMVESDMWPLVYGFCLVYHAYMLVRASGNPVIKGHLASKQLIDVPFWFAGTGLHTQIEQDLGIGDRWGDLLSFLIRLVPALVVYPIVCTVLRLVLHRYTHFVQLLEISILFWIMMRFLRIHVILDIIFMNFLFLALGYLSRGHSCVIWTTALLGMHWTDERLHQTHPKGLLFSLGYERVPGEVYSAYFMCMLRAMTVAFYMTGSMDNISSIPRSISMKQTAKYLFNLIQYVFYPYCFFYGPLIMFSDWQSYRNQSKVPRGTEVKSLGLYRVLSYGTLLHRFLRLVTSLILWCTLSLCIVYPRAILSYPLVSNASTAHASDNGWQNLSADATASLLAFSVMVCAFDFYLRHYTVYATAALLSDFSLLLNTKYLSTRRRQLPSGLASTDKRSTSSHRNQMHMAGHEKTVSLCLVVAPPSCIALHLKFSEVWRTFDRGLYNFIVCHIYRPLVRPKCAGNSSTLIVVFRQALGLCASFLFVLFLHYPDRGNVMWVLLNIVQLTTERVLTWSYNCTCLGRLVQQYFSTQTLWRLYAVLGVIGWAWSAVSFVYFQFGYHVGHLFVQHVLFAPELWTIYLMLYGRWHLVSWLRDRYAVGVPLPSGFHDTETTTAPPNDRSLRLHGSVPRKMTERS